MEAFDFDSFEEQMQNALDALGREFGRVRSGRASPSLVDKVMVEAYGSEMPMSQVATISIPEARTIVKSAQGQRSQLLAGRHHSSGFCKC